METFKNHQPAVLIYFYFCYTAPNRRGARCGCGCGCGCVCVGGGSRIGCAKPEADSGCVAEV